MRAFRGFAARSAAVGLCAAAGVSLTSLVAAAPAHAEVARAGAHADVGLTAALAARPDVVVTELAGVPAASLLGRGRVLVLRPHTLEIALNGRVRRAVAVRQPLDLAQLPALVGEPAYAARTGPDGVRLGAVLVQRPGTAVMVTGGRLDLADTGGAGPGRLTGTRAGIDLRGVTVTASSALGAGATPGARIVTAGLRYLHDSDVHLQDVVLRGLGTPGPAGIAAVRVGGGSRVLLTSVTLVAGGRGLQLDQPAVLAVEGLTADHATGDVLGLVGGSGATISHLRTTGTAGAALRLRATAATTLSGFVSAGDARALVATDVAGLHADGVRAAGSGLLVGGRSVDLEAPVVEAPVVALQVDGGSDVTVRGGSLRGTAAVRADVQSQGVRLEGVTTRGLIAGPVGVRGGLVESRARGAAAGAVGPAGGSWWSGRWGGRLRGAGGVVVVVVVGGLLLEVLRGRRREARRGGSGEGDRRGSRGRAPALPLQRDAAAGVSDLVLDLGETPAP